ncbi:putative surface protease GP63 [Trypanosoma cruzi]|nr:putative surface protease GP63 [Trypanosoma cruzi]
MEEGEANRSGTLRSTACTHGESGPSCRHPARGVRTHKRIGAAHTATQQQSTIEKERSPHTTWIVGPREVRPIFTTITVQLPFAFVHIQRTPLHASTATTAAARTRDKKMQRMGDSVGDRGAAVAAGADVVVTFSLLVTDVVLNSSGCLTESGVGRQLMS